MACRRPLYEPMSFNLLILSCNVFLASLSMGIWPSSAVSEVMVLGANEPMVARLCIEYLAMMRSES